MLHQLYQGDTSTPASTEEDYEVRTKLLEVAINLWASERGVAWRELFYTASGTTSLGSTISLSSFTDYKYAAGYLRIKIDGTNWTYIPIYDVTKAELYKNSANNPQFAYITGNKKTGFTINLSFTVAASLSWELPYYKDPFIPSTGSNVIEMADPLFAVYYVLSKLHETDGEGDRATLAYQLANEKLGAMKLQNSKAPPWQDNAVPDLLMDQGVGGFGN